MKQLTRSKYENFEKTVKFLALNYFLKKVLSSSGMVLNALLGYYDSITIQMTIQYFLAQKPSKVQHW